MRFSHFFIVRPIFASVISLFILIIGAIAYLALPVSQFPDIVPPTVSVSATYPGASAETVADTVAAVIEQEVNGVDGMIYMYSQSTNDGSMSLNVTFEIGTDIDEAQVLVQNRVSAAEPRIPEDVRRNGITVRKNSPDLLLVVHLISPDKSYDQVYTSNYGLLNVRDELARIPGVGSVNMFGAREYSMRVWLDPERIAARGMTAEEVLSALRQQNVQVAGGAIGQPPVQETGAFQVQLQLKGRLQRPEEFGEIVLKTGQDGRVVRVKDVGRAELGALNYATYGYQDRSPATVLVVTQQPGSNALNTAAAIKREMQRLSQSFPQGLEYRIIYNPTEFIEVSIRELYVTIIEAVALVVLVVLLFLQTWRATIIPLVAIPVSLVGTFAVMQGFGFSINMLTLFGLVLAVGIVVDDAIVVVENVERKLADGLSPKEAARVTMDEVGTALIAIALVLSAVFIPTAFVGGITGQFFRQFAITVATATIISAFNSLTLSPALCALLLKPHTGHERESLLIRPVHAFFRWFNRAFDALARGYARLLRGVIRLAPAMLALYLGLIGLAGWLLFHTPTGFIPKMDRGILIVSLQLPPGASLARTDDVVKRANDMLLALPGVVHTSGYTGRSGATFTNATNAGAIFVVMADAEERHRLGLDAEKIAAAARAKLAELEEASAFVFIPPPVRGMGGQTGFSMRLQNARQPVGRRLRQGRAGLHPGRQRDARHHPGVHDVRHDHAADLRRRRPRQGADAEGAARHRLRGAARLHGLGLRQRLQHVRPHLPRHGTGRLGDSRIEPENVARIRVRNADGQMVPLGSFVTFREIAGPDRVPRYNLFPAGGQRLRARPASARARRWRSWRDSPRDQLPDGITYEWTDLSYQEAKVGRTGYYVFLLSVLFVFLALSAQYESWSLPLAIMLIVPMCLFSAPFGVWLHGQDINILTQIGFVVLIGLAAKNAILIVEFARQIEEQGRDRRHGSGRGLPAAPAADPDDVARLHARRGAALSGDGRRRGDAHRARHGRVLGHDRRDAVRPRLHADLLRRDPRADLAPPRRTPEAAPHAAGVGLQNGFQLASGVKRM